MNKIGTSEFNVKVGFPPFIDSLKIISNPQVIREGIQFHRNVLQSNNRHSHTDCVSHAKSYEGIKNLVKCDKSIRVCERTRKEMKLNIIFITI